MAQTILFYGRAVGVASLLLPSALLLFIARSRIASVFFLSGRAKVDGIFDITDRAYALFRTEYALPLVPSDLVAVSTAAIEHIFPILLLIGLGTRIAASVLIGMTLAIQMFVYPDAWSVHLGWLSLLLPIVARGGGAWSIDAAINRLTQDFALLDLTEDDALLLSGNPKNSD